MRSVTKNKQNLTNQVKRRFHFDPKSASSKPKIISKAKYSNQNGQSQKDGQFSSVKEKNEFNDSSWLAKLVNGIQENPSGNSSKNCQKIIVTQISQLPKKQCIYPTKKNSCNSINTITGHDRKNSMRQYRSFERKKSVPSTYSETNHRRTSSKFSKPNQKTKQVNKTKKIENNNKKFEYNIQECGLESKQLNCNDNRNKHRQSLQKNSLISYSSIGMDDLSQEMFVLKETQTQKKDTKLYKKNSEEMYINKLQHRNKQKPINFKEVIETKNIVNEQQMLTKQHKKQGIIENSHKKYNYEINVSDPTQVPQKILNKSPFKKKTDEDYINQFIHISETPIHSFIAKNNRESIVKIQQPNIQIYNQQCNDKPKRSGIIRKNNKSNIQKMSSIKYNNIQNQKEQHKISPLKYNYDVNVAPPNQSIVTIKKASRSYSNQPNKLILQQQITYKDLNQKQIASYKPKYGLQFAEQQDKKVIQIFNKLNIGQKQIINQHNYCQQKLNEKQKYQVGPILSKIKYMNKSYTQKQFMQDCKRINMGASDCSKRRKNIEQIPKGKLKKNINRQQIPFNHHINNLNQIDNFDHKTQHRYVPQTRKYSYLETERQNKNIQTQTKNKQNIDINTNKDRKYRIQSYSKDLSKRQFSPLFPQNKLINQNNQNTTPNKSPYIQMPSYPDLGLQFRMQQEFGNKDNKSKNATMKNIGNMIDNINQKINCYIQNHHLQDTFRDFKLDFAHLKQNRYN